MKTRTATTMALLLLTLTGCTGTAEDAGHERTAPAATESAAPLTAETAEATPADDIEAEFIDRFHDFRAQNTLPSQIPDATDEQLISAGYDGCARLEAGEVGEDISLIDGETRSEAGLYVDSGAILSAASVTLCAD